MDTDDILLAVKGVTAKWKKQRTSEVRRTSHSRRRSSALRWWPSRVTIKRIAYEYMEQAYQKASGGGRYPAHARQVYYAARQHILEKADCDHLDANYFTQVLLPDYMNDHDVDWNVVFDARGHFYEPHTDKEVALGTLGVRKYLGDVRSHCVRPVEARIGEKSYPTCGPENRYGAVLFIEKEGFFPLFEQVNLAEKYDLAIMSSKGMSNTATRELVDGLCSGVGGLRLLVLHDFDKAGFSILGTLHRDTRRYEFSGSVNIVDLGIRLGDVQEYGLQSEACSCDSGAAGNLEKNGATKEEIEFLTTGARVELNAFSSDEFIEWIESKLEDAGVEKVLPEREALAEAYRRLAFSKLANDYLARFAEAIMPRVAAIEVKADRLLGQIGTRQEEDPLLSWDQALADLIDEGVDDDEVVPPKKKGGPAARKKKRKKRSGAKAKEKPKSTSKCTICKRPTVTDWTKHLVDALVKPDPPICKECCAAWPTVEGLGEPWFEKLMGVGEIQMARIRKDVERFRAEDDDAKEVADEQRS